MARDPEKSSSYKVGVAAELMASLFLILKGYRILARRYKTPVGEIDLVARRGQVLAFVEVKARRNIDDALTAVTPQMRTRIARAAGHFISRYPVYASLTLRFDLVAVAPPFYWCHLDNAWQPAA